MLGLRFTFHTPQLEPLLTEGHMDWLWSQAEKNGIPLMVLVPPRLLPHVRAVAERYPGLKLTLDHMSVPKGAKDEAAFAHIDDLLPLAKQPNIAVKATSVPHYSSAPWPHAHLHGHLRRVYDAFGPKRIFWGSDLTKVRNASYCQIVTLFTEELPWLSAEDKEWIMGRALCEWLGWAHPRLAVTRDS